MNIFNVYPRFDLALVKGRGVHVFDDNGVRYLDLYGGHGVISIGHGHPRYIRQLKGQLNRIGYYSNSVAIPYQEQLAEELGAMCGYPEHDLFLCNSGAEANENAIKLASFHTGRKKVIAFKGSFHGRTAAALNTTDNPAISAPIHRNNFPTVFIALNDRESLVNALEKRDTCAVILEGIQGVGGLDAPTVDYLEFTSKVCQKYGAMLIVDEIQSGYGRSGKFFAHQYADIQADLVTVAKGMANGFPIGGVLIHKDIQAKYGMLGTTFGGNHLACVAALAVLETIREEKLMDNAQRIYAFLKEELSAISPIQQVKGRGLMLGLEFDFPIKELRSKLLCEHHILTGSSSNPNLLRILPPLSITKEEIHPFIEALKKELL